MGQSDPEAHAVALAEPNAPWAMRVVPTIKMLNELEPPRAW